MTEQAAYAASVSKATSPNRQRRHIHIVRAQSARGRGDRQEYKILFRHSDVLFQFITCTVSVKKKEKRKIKGIKKLYLLSQLILLWIEYFILGALSIFAESKRYTTIITRSLRPLFLSPSIDRQFMHLDDSSVEVYLGGSTVKGAPPVQTQTLKGKLRQLLAKPQQILR